MVELTLKILDKEGNVKTEGIGSNEVRVVFEGLYEEGDKIIIGTSTTETYLVAQIDDAMGSSFVYITEKEVTYEIPFGEKRVSFSPKVFYGDKHLLSVRLAKKEEIEEYKNLACNVMDNHNVIGLYPHASANVETRGEAVLLLEMR